MPFDPIVTGPHQHPNSGRGDSKGRDPMPLDDVPEPVGLRTVGDPFNDQDGAAEKLHSDDHPGPHHPADVRQPEKLIVWFEIEVVTQFLSHLGQAASMGVDRSLRPARRAGGVQNQGRVFRIQPAVSHFSDCPAISS